METTDIRSVKDRFACHVRGIDFWRWEMAKPLSSLPTIVFDNPP